MLQVRNILVAKDLSESAGLALRAAYELAVRMRATLHLLFVQVEHPDPFAPATYPADHRERVHAAMRKVVEEVESERSEPPGDRPNMIYAVEAGLAVAPAVVSYAARNEVDVIVTGTHGRRGMRHLMLGSVAEEVVRTAECPVLTVRGTPGDRALLPGAGSDILVPVDFSDHSIRAIRYARELASLFGCGIRMVHVVEETLHPAFYNAGAFSIYDLQPDVEVRALEHMRREFSAVPGPDVPVTFEVTSGHAAVEIGNMTRDLPVGLVVMATHGLTGFAHLFLGSVAEHVARISAVPVFSVKSFGRDLFVEAPERRETQHA
jgi:nucleotide-binding universal stress UspA family protein